MKTAVFKKLIFSLLCLLFAGLFFGVEKAAAQIAHGVAIDGRRDILIQPLTAPDKQIGTLFKRRGDFQQFRIRNPSTFCWNLGIIVPGNFSVIRPPSPNPLPPGGQSFFTLSYLGGPTTPSVPPNTEFTLILIDCDNPLHGHAYQFGLDNTPKKRKLEFDGVARNLRFKDVSGVTKVPTTPISLNLPLGRGSFNGTLFTSTSSVFGQNVVFQGRIRELQQRRGGKKMTVEGYWRWKFNRLGFPDVAQGRNFRATIKTNNKKETVIQSRIFVTNAVGKDKDFSFSGGLKATLTSPGQL